MSIKTRLMRGWKHDREILKTLTFRQKIRFILDYYRGLMFLFLVFLLLLFYIFDMVSESRQTIDLQGFFVNDRQDLFPAEELMDEFSEYYSPESGHRIAFEDSLYVDLSSSNQYNAASQSKIVAYMAAKELDFLVAPKELAQYYAQSFILYDLDELLPGDLRSELQDDLYYAEDGSGTEKACCLDLKDSRFLDDPVYDGADSYYLMVLGYTPRTDAMTAFLRWAYDYK